MSMQQKEHVDLSRDIESGATVTGGSDEARTALVIGDDGDDESGKGGGIHRPDDGCSSREAQLTWAPPRYRTTTGPRHTP